MLKMTAMIAVSEASSTSKFTATEVIELPRYRKRHSTSQDTRRADIDSPLLTYSNAIESTVSPSTSTTLALSSSLATRSVVRTLTFRRPVIFSDITVHAVNPVTNADTPVYHAQTHEWNFWQPDIILYAGPQPDPAHILAVSRFRWSRDAGMGFGSNCLNEAAIDTQWEDMRNTSNWLAHYQYDFSIPAWSSSDGSTGGRKFRWLRTRTQDDGVEGWGGYLSLRNYKLLDLETGEVIAVFLADNLRSLTKKGELRLFVPLAKEAEMAVVLSMCSISEKATRRGRAEKRFR